MQLSAVSYLVYFFFNDPPTPAIYTLSLHDALPIRAVATVTLALPKTGLLTPEAASYVGTLLLADVGIPHRSEEHTSELQSPMYLVCRLLLEKKKNQISRLITRSYQFST